MSGLVDRRLVATRRALHTTPSTRSPVTPDPADAEARMLQAGPDNPRVCTT
jgi:hypothetical protein